MIDLKIVDEFVEKVEKSRYQTLTKSQETLMPEKLKIGVDLGTAYIGIVVLDNDNNPLACELKAAEVVRDGLVVDYMGAIKIVRNLKEKLESRLGAELKRAAIAVPSETSEADSKTHKHVVEAAGMEVVNILDEPSAANSVLNVTDGAVVDIGGGTTGISIFKNSELVRTADEATGGTHLSLTIAGNYKIDFKEAEKIKVDPERQSEVYSIVLPVLNKMGTIVKEKIGSNDVNELYLVGGTSCLKGIEKAIAAETGIKTYKPYNPFLVTPLGIALNCI
jgi:ethanolamine utilization protein EutJ